MISAEVLNDEKIPDGAKILYGEIRALCGSEGYCFATNEYLAKRRNRSKETVRAWITLLCELNYLKRVLIFEDDKRNVKERRLYITENNCDAENSSEGIVKNDTYTERSAQGINENLPTVYGKNCTGYTGKSTEGIKKNLQDNNTYNNTVNNTVNKHVCYPQDFEILWEIYPRKLNKKGAFKAYLARLKEGAKSDELLRAAENYLRSIKDKGTAERFIMHASTFFGADKRYEDYLEYHEEKLVTRCRIVAEDDDLPFG